MTPERIAALVARWARLYTRRLPAPIAERRLEELGADVHDHIAHERAHGTGDRRIALDLLSRLARGLPADVSWRGRRSPVARSVVRVALVTAAILLVPLVAMQLSGEVAWSPADFAVAAVLIGGAGLLQQLAARRVSDLTYRAAAGVALAAGFLLTWTALAVGVVGAPDEPLNALYAGVLAVGAVGVLLARGRPRRMAGALLAAALAQALAAAVALVASLAAAPHDGLGSVADVLGVNGLFVLLFAGSAWLFARADRCGRAPVPAPRRSGHRDR